MTRLVLDASVAAKWLLDEEYSDEAARLMDIGYAFAVPDLFFLELASILKKNVSRGVVTSAEAEGFLRVASRVVASVHPSIDLVERALHIAIRYDITPYDASYLVVANDERTQCVTADRKLFDRLRHTSSDSLLAWMGDVAPPVVM